jgi:putative phosphoesterase
MTTLGVLADTHIPDRVPTLNPRVIQVFRQAQVSAILHAGDVSVPQVLAELEKIAQVYAVRGNRDIFLSQEITFTNRSEHRWSHHRYGTRASIIPPVYGG